MALRITKDNFKEKVIESELPVIVDFYSDSCIACKKLSPVLGDIEDAYEDKINVYKLNTRYDTEVAEDYSVMSNPTLILFQNGHVLDKKVGVASYDELVSWINNKM